MEFSFASNECFSSRKRFEFHLTVKVLPLKYLKLIEALRILQNWPSMFRNQVFTNKS